MGESRMRTKRLILESIIGVFIGVITFIYRWWMLQNMPDFGVKDSVYSMILVLGDGGFIECLWEYSFIYNLLEKFKKDGYKFFVCLVEFSSKAIWSQTFVFREYFYYIFHFISSDQSVQIIYFFLIQFWQAVSRKLSISSWLSNLLAYNCS